VEHEVIIKGRLMAHLKARTTFAVMSEDRQDPSRRGLIVAVSFRRRFMFNVNAHGASIPALGFGVFRMSEEEVERIVPEALAVGFRHFDTAQIYGNEAALGRALAMAGARRDELFLTTKVWVENYTPDRFAASVDESLDRLKVDQVDLLLIHWPGDGADRAPDRMARCGQGFGQGAPHRREQPEHRPDARIGQPEQGAHRHQSGGDAPLSRPVEAAGRRASGGVALTAYYGMADGKVIGDPVIQAIAAKYGKTPAQTVLRWLVQHEGVIALSKTAKVERVAENFAIFDFALEAGDMAAIDALARPNGRLVSPAGLAPEWDR
jgi:diketogulonate reductase-like aldo/keto reductase